MYEYIISRSTYKTNYNIGFDAFVNNVAALWFQSAACVDWSDWDVHGTEGMAEWCLRMVVWCYVDIIGMKFLVSNDSIDPHSQLLFVTLFRNAEMMFPDLEFPSDPEQVWHAQIYD